MRHKILLIEDDRDDQVNFCRCIYELDPSIECLVASNGSEALLHLKAVTQKSGFIFLDLNMPLMDGYEYLAQIRAQRLYDDIPVVIFTTSNDEADKEKSRLCGVAGYLIKPANLKVLKIKLDLILKQFFKPLVGHNY